MKESTEMMGVTFNGSVTFNGPMFDIHDNEHVTIVNDRQRQEAPLTASEKDIKKAIEKLMEAQDENGAFIMRDQDQWYAVFRVLSAKCGFPQKAKDFTTTMANLSVDNLRVPCRYESIRKVSLHNLPQNVDLWHQFQNKADQYSMKQLVVAVKLLELLE